MSKVYLQDITLPTTEWGDKTYSFVQTDADLDTAGDAADAKKTGDEITALKQDLSDAETALETKAEIDGSYDNMTVGNAKQLVATVGITDKTPYNFRTSGGSVDIGDRERDTIVGGTVAWNQLIRNGNFADGAFGWGGLGSWKSYEVVDGTLHLVSNANQVEYANVYRPIANGVKVNHVYVVSYYVKASKDSITSGSLGTLSGGGGISGQTSYTANAWFHRCGLSKPTSYTDDQLYIRPKMTTDAEEVDVYLKNINCTDLTQMFGSTIADYIYGLEQSQAGTGVAWFKKLFPKPYYAYNAGSLLSVQTSEHKMVGFNQWDEEWEVGAYSSANGNKVTVSDRIRSKNYIPVLPSTKYYISKGLQIYYYDADHNYINWSGIGAATTFTTAANVHYITFNALANTGTTYNHDICINLSWDGERDGEYEPYVEYVYPLDDSLTLRGIPKLDSGNNLYYDGDVYEADGTVTRKYGIVDLGTLTWIKQGDGCFYADISDKTQTSANVNLVCAKYSAFVENATGISVFDYLTDKTITGIKRNSPSTNSWVYVKDSAYTSGETFKTSLSGVYLVYELAEPTTETADPFTNPQIVDDFGTEEYVDAGVTTSTPTRDVAIPVGHETVYQANLRAKLEMAPNSPDGDGDYIVRQTNGENEYVLLEEELPSAPSSDGTYVLKATVASGTATLTWVEET